MWHKELSLLVKKCWTQMYSFKLSTVYNDMITCLFLSGYVREVWSFPGVFQARRWWKVAAGPQNRGIVYTHKWNECKLLFVMDQIGNDSEKNIHFICKIFIHIQNKCSFVCVFRWWRTTWVLPGRSLLFPCRPSVPATWRGHWRFHRSESASVENNHSSVHVLSWHHSHCLFCRWTALIMTVMGLMIWLALSLPRSLSCRKQDRVLWWAY